MADARKTRGSQNLKDAYGAFKKLSGEDKVAFFNKVFAVALRGLNADVKKSIKSRWKNLQRDIKIEQDKQATIDGLDKIELPILEAAVARRKKATAKSKQHPLYLYWRRS